MRLPPALFAAAGCVVVVELSRSEERERKKRQSTRKAAASDTEHINIPARAPASQPTCQPGCLAACLPGRLALFLRSLARSLAHTILFKRNKTHSSCRLRLPPRASRSLRPAPDTHAGRAGNRCAARSQMTPLGDGGGLRSAESDRASDKAKEGRRRRKARSGAQQKGQT